MAGRKTSFRKTKYRVQTGRYVRFSLREDTLRIFLLPEGRELLRDYREENKRREKAGDYRYWKSDFAMFYDLLEDFFGNGWIEVKPQDVGDMRDDYWLVISQDYVYADAEDDEKGLIVGTAYSFFNYAVDSYTEGLVKKGYIDFGRHDYLTRQEMEYEIARLRPDLFDAEGERLRLRLIEQGERYTFWTRAAESGQMALPLAA